MGRRRSAAAARGGGGDPRPRRRRTIEAVVALDPGVVDVAAADRRPADGGRRGADGGRGARRRHPRVPGRDGAARRHRLRRRPGRRLVGRALRRRPRSAAAARPRASPSCDPRPGDNGYARPVEGVIVARRPERARGAAGRRPRRRADAARGRQLRRRTSPAPLRDDIKPLEITQPEGPSFAVDGHVRAWQKWQLRVGFTPREGLVLTPGRLRRRRAAALDPVPRLALARWSSPTATRARATTARTPSTSARTASASLANSLELGLRLPRRDPLLRRGRLATAAGEPVHDPERHLHARGGRRHALEAHRLARRTGRGAPLAAARGLLVRDDRQLRLRLLLVPLPGRHDRSSRSSSPGMLSTGARRPGERARARHARRARAQRAGPPALLQRAARLRRRRAGRTRSTRSDASRSRPGPDNPHGNAFRAAAAAARDASEARRRVDAATARCWQIVNPAARNASAQPVGYRLVPGENAAAVRAARRAASRKRAGFIAQPPLGHAVRPDERYAAGDYPNQHPGGDGLPAWTRGRPADRRTPTSWSGTRSATTTSPRPEDWPVMPVDDHRLHAQAGRLLRPQPRARRAALTAAFGPLPTREHHVSTSRGASPSHRPHRPPPPPTTPPPPPTPPPPRRAPRTPTCPG